MVSATALKQDARSKEVRVRGEYVFLRKAVMDSELEIRQLVRIYLDSFDAISSLTPCTQYYSKEEIGEVLGDSEMVKYIIYYRGKPVGFGLATLNLEKVPWVNLNFYRKHFPEAFRENRVLYYKGIVIEPEFQSTIIQNETGVKVKIVSELFNFSTENFPDRAVLAFDCSEKMNSWMCDSIIRSTGCLFPSEKTNYDKFSDRQVYYILEKRGEVVDLFQAG